MLDAIVVGAGAAGLVAARELTAAGLTVRVLEARARVGGRAWTDREPFGVPIDRGCAWLHSAGWAGDPWARGAYSAARPGFAHCRATLTKPVAERVFFAGDACTIDTFGAIQGAWASGAAAARQIVAALAVISHEGD